MQETEIIGKIAHYHPLNSREPIESRVISSRILTNLAGKRMTLLKLENGDEPSANECYFDLSSDSASS